MLIKKGAEANIYLESWHNRKVIFKKRLPKIYRQFDLDHQIRVQRTKHEPQAMHHAKKAGVPTPIVFMVDMPRTTIIMEYIEGNQVKHILNLLSREKRVFLCKHIGKLTGQLHQKGIIHGDLTTSNIIQTPLGRVVMIDFGLSEFTNEPEARGVDLHLMKRSLLSTHHLYAKEFFTNIMKGYNRIMGRSKAIQVWKKISEIEKRGRYISER